MKPRLMVASCIMGLFALHAEFLHADDAPASKAAVAQAAPAGDAAVGDEVIRSAKSYFALLRDANDDDEKAYERMSADYRKEHTADEFKQALESWRSAGTTIPNSVSVSGEVAMKPKDGGPPRATLRAQQSMGSRFASGPVRSRPLMLTVGLVQEDGKWKVAALHDNVRREGAIDIGKAPRVDRRGAGTLRVSSLLEGKLTKVNEDSIVIRVEGGSKDAPATERTLKLDDETPVTVGTEVNLPTGRAPVTPGNGSSRSMRITRGTRADIKPDRRASVEMSNDLTRAESVMVIEGPDPNAPPEGL